ncbi:arylsulfatase [Fulvitalea axinellae]|uniref:Arylsulfatase n=1 Tax=Fulvitalea axinellae TaxID=1182444 RepID=A0AAU9CEU2_9BACT|nr:arylsulfatase [Fulvitalea axinellae]
MFRRIISARMAALGIALPLFFGSCQKKNGNEAEATQTASDKDLPNVIFILADDMGYGDLSALNPEAGTKTTHMDRIVNEGMYFADAHSNSAVCTPTRYGVLTGRYAFRTRMKSGVLVGHSPSLIEPGRETVASMLQAYGYETGCVGKWHLGLDWAKKNASEPLITGNMWNQKGRDTKNIDYSKPVHGGPNDHGFDYSYIIPASLDMEPYVYLKDGKVENQDIIKVEPSLAQNAGRGVFWRGGDASSDFKHDKVMDVITQKSVEFIKKDRNKPFFLYFPLTAPHTPWLPTDKFAGTSKAGRYGDFVQLVDSTVGQVLKALDEKGIAENTLVIVTSDNGSHWKPSDKKEYPNHKANHVFSGMKSDAWEGGHHVPFIARWPKKIKAGTNTDQITCTTDLFATCADIVGHKMAFSEAEDSYSFLPKMTGESGSELRQDIIHHGIGGMFAYRKGKWKFIDGKGSGGWSDNGKSATEPGQLYDMSKDIGERTNLYAENPEQVKEMKATLEMYKKELRSRY